MPPLVTVVDDSYSVRDALPALLRVCGYAADCYASAEEFLQAQTHGNTDCLLLDVELPGMSGPDLLALLKTKCVPPPVIFISGRLDQLGLQRLQVDGVVACLAKPFSEEELLEAIDRALVVGQ
ncbi:MAG TPA: response regulator [Steroidobacteraceae bacterium]|jgi:FixJ family two-component response regulator